MSVIRRFFWFVPTVVWMIVIFQFSGQDGELSAGLSYKVTAEIADFLHVTVLRDKSPEELIETLHPVVRKGAHMTEYAILMTLLFLSFFFSMLVAVNVQEPSTLNAPVSAWTPPPAATSTFVTPNAPK